MPSPERCSNNGALEETRGRILATIETLRAQPDSEAQATTLVTALNAWSSLRRPVQVHEAARGLDDPASAALCGAARRLVLLLSNEHHQYEIALRVARALLACFRLVPARHAELQRELPVLIGNALVDRVRQLHDMALEQWRPVVVAIEAGALDGGTGITGSLAGLMAEADDHADPEVRAAVFLTLRDLAVKLHNERRQVRAAYLLIAWLAGRGPPPELAPRLEETSSGSAFRPVSFRSLRHDPMRGNCAPTSFGRARRPAASERHDARPVPGRTPRRIKRPRLPSSLARQSPSATARNYVGVGLLFFWIVPMCSVHHRPASPPAYQPMTGVRFTPQTHASAASPDDVETALARHRAEIAQHELRDLRVLEALHRQDAAAAEQARP